MIKVTRKQVRVDTRTLEAVFDNGALVSLVRKSDGRRLIRGKASGQPAPLELVFPGNELSGLAGSPGDRVSCRRLNDRRAEIRFESWNGDGILDIREDAETGDMIVEPSGYSSRPGLVACRWNMAGIDQSLRLVAPFFQGVNLPLKDPLIRDTRWPWPHFWEAGLAILQGREGGFWVHCRDDGYRYKALEVGAADDPFSIGLDSEAYGPIDGNLGAGGIAWRVNVYQGDWQEPAGQYRDWLWSAWDLAEAERAEWVLDLRFGISWCPTDENILKALAKRIDPRKVLLHIPHWRQDPYDENYPRYVASETGSAFVKKAQAMGFHAMPHFNSVDMDPSHPVYTSLRDFQYRELTSKRVQGWTWVDGKVRPVPESNAARLRHRDKKTMVKIHPGLAMWRSILAENVLGAAKALLLETVFLDVSLCTWNIHNCLVENQTPSEGMHRLIEKVADLGKGLAVGGEGRNEVTFRAESFGQVHLFKSWQTSLEGLERTGGTPLNEFLFGRICRSFGYSSLGGRDRGEEMRMNVHVSLGAIPTVTVRSGTEIARPNKAVREMLRLATE